MRQLVAILIFVVAATVAQAKQNGDARSTVRAKDPPKASVTTPDRLLRPQDARGKTVESYPTFAPAGEVALQAGSKGCSNPLRREA